MRRGPRISEARYSLSRLACASCRLAVYVSRVQPSSDPASFESCHVALRVSMLRGKAHRARRTLDHRRLGFGVRLRGRLPNLQTPGVAEVGSCGAGVIFRFWAQTRIEGFLGLPSVSCMPRRSVASLTAPVWNPALGEGSILRCGRLIRYELLTLTDGTVNLTCPSLISRIAGSPVPLSVTSYSPTGPSHSSGNRLTSAP